MDGHPPAPLADDLQEQVEPQDTPEPADLDKDRATLLAMVKSQLISIIDDLGLDVNYHSMTKAQVIEELLAQKRHISALSKEMQTIATATAEESRTDLPGQKRETATIIEIDETADTDEIDEHAAVEADDGLQEQVGGQFSDELEEQEISNTALEAMVKSQLIVLVEDLGLDINYYSMTKSQIVEAILRQKRHKIARAEKTQTVETTVQEEVETDFVEPSKGKIDFQEQDGKTTSIEEIDETTSTKEIDEYAVDEPVKAQSSPAPAKLELSDTSLESMVKSQLIVIVEDLGLDINYYSMTKSQIAEAILAQKKHITVQAEKTQTEETAVQDEVETDFAEPAKGRTDSREQNKKTANIEEIDEDAADEPTADPHTKDQSREESADEPRKRAKQGDPAGPPKMDISKVTRGTLQAMTKPQLTALIKDLNLAIKYSSMKKAEIVKAVLAEKRKKKKK